MSCPHTEFEARAAVGRVVDDETQTTLQNLTIDLSVVCLQCGVPVQFYGLPLGVSTHMPTLSVDGLEARLVGFPQGETMPERKQISAIFHRPEGNS